MQATEERRMVLAGEVVLVSLPVYVCDGCGAREDGDFDSPAHIHVFDGKGVVDMYYPPVGWMVSRRRTTADRDVMEALCHCPECSSAHMDLDRASSIVSECVAHHFVAMGIAAGPAPSLDDYSLAELLEANRMIKVANAGAGTTHQVHCDDRLVAALYALYNYEPSELDKIDPIVQAPGRALCCVAVKQNQDQSP